MFENVIETEDELRSILGGVSEVATRKVINHIDYHCKNFISKSPFLVLATSDQNGLCDVSPRGDEPGFVLSLNEKYIVIPERKGNNRADSLRNILQNPQIGLLFIIPGLKETLRVNGKARIIRDEEILKQMEAKGKVPIVGIAVEVEECFIQCGKALKRSSLWESEMWLKKEELPSAAKILSDHVNLPGVDEAAIKARLEEGYVKRLY